MGGRRRCDRGVSFVEALNGGEKRVDEIDLVCEGVEGVEGCVADRPEREP